MSYITQNQQLSAIPTYGFEDHLEGDEQQIIQGTIVLFINEAT